MGTRAHDLVRPKVLPMLKREAKKYNRLQQAQREADARIASAEELQKKLLSKQKTIEASLRAKLSKLERMESELARQRTDFHAETAAERIYLAELTARLGRCATECTTRASLLTTRESEFQAKLQRQSKLVPVRRSLHSEARVQIASDLAATDDPMSVTSSYLPEAIEQGFRAISKKLNGVMSNLEVLEGAQSTPVSSSKSPSCPSSRSATP